MESTTILSIYEWESKSKKLSEVKSFDLHLTGKSVVYVRHQVYAIKYCLKRSTCNTISNYSNFRNIRELTCNPCEVLHTCNMTSKYTNGVSIIHPLNIKSAVTAKENTQIS